MAWQYHRARQRGVSLLEALVAMAVMGFGMLAIVGVQGNLSFNADMARQRAEATRIAEQELELVRAFTKVASADTSEKEFDRISSKDEASKPASEFNNAEFRVKRDVRDTADGLGKMIAVVVKWVDRTGVERQVAMHDLISRADPMLSGFVKAERPLTGIGRRGGRHPTIPVDAVNVDGGGKSIFVPPNGAGVGWVFDNATGAITHTCTSIVTVSDTTFASNCTLLKDADNNPTPALLVSGQVHFNLRGATYNPAGTLVSVMKPAANGDSAWVIRRTTSRLVQICPVPIEKSTTDLTASDIASSCKDTDVLLGPYTPVDAGDLTPADSENPLWPTLPATVEFDKSWANRSSELDSKFECFADYQTSTLAHTDSSGAPDRKWINYFCIVRVPKYAGWVGRTVVKPLTFTETFSGGTGGTWKVGTEAGEYRVCRYTLAQNDYTDNDDHPATYAAVASSCTTPVSNSCQPVRRNLVNQNFLVIAGSKNCPVESTPVDPASGNMINSNTRQHQPML